MIEMITAEMLDKLTDPIIIDVRDYDEYATGHIAGSIHLPLQYFEARILALDKTKKYHILCHSGSRSQFACMIAEQYGYDVVNVVGGINAYKGELTYEM